MNLDIEKIKAALVMGEDFFTGFTCTCDPEVGLTCEPCARGWEMKEALAALKAYDPTALEAERDRYKADAERLACCVADLIEDACEAYSSHEAAWGNYRKEARDAIKERIIQARAAIAAHEEGTK